MRLELQIVKIRGIQFGDKTAVQSGVLTINRNELVAILEQDKRLGRVDIELAHPGESCRIFQVADVIEPRAKILEGNVDSIRMAGKHPQTGEGKTCVLSGAAVVLIDNRKIGEDSAGMDPRDHIIDMFGPGSEAGIFGKTFNIVLIPQQTVRTNALEYQAALKVVGTRTATYLALAGKDVEPDDVEVYDLPSLAEVSKGLEGLPKVIYIYQILSLQYEPIPGEPTFFGAQAGGIAPTILHPNQILDGAVTSALPGLNMQTYRIQNHPLIKELYRLHGKDLCFSGVVATVAPNNIYDMDRIANTTAAMAKWVVGADGAILTKAGGGAPELAMAKTAQRCEQLGIKTAIAMLHMGADASDTKYGATTIFNLPEVDAIVSMGFPFTTLKLPPVARVIGTPEETQRTSGGEVLIKPLGSIYGTLCQLGSSKHTAVRY